MKPDIVFFGEGLPDVFHHTLEQDKLSVSINVLVCTHCVYLLSTLIPMDKIMVPLLIDLAV